MNTETGFTYKTSLDVSYQDAIEKVTSALKEEGFGVLTEIDVKETLKKKLDEEFRLYVILGACNPHLAHQALNVELDIGALLPCNVIIYEEDGGSVVSIVDPISMLGVADNAALDPIANEARERLKRVIKALRK